MAGVLVPVEGDLPEDGRKGVFALVAEHREADLGVFFLGHDPVERERLAKHGGGLGQRQWRVVVKDVLLRREPVVQPVAELVGQGQRIAQLAGEVHQHVGVVVRRHGHAVGAPLLARHDGRVDPALLEEFFDQRSGTLRKATVRTQHELLRVVPGQVTRHVADRRVAVPLVQVAYVEQLAFDAVVTNAHVVAAGHRVDERLHRLVGCLVGEVARADPGGEVAQTVVDRLLLEDDVEDVAAGANVAAQSLGHRTARLAAHVAVWFAQQVERLVERELLSVRDDVDPRAQLLEQPHPGRRADRAEVVEDTLLGLRHLVGPELARLFDSVPIDRCSWVGVQLGRLLVGDLRELEREEHHVAAPLRSRFAHAGEQPTRGVLLGVLAVEHVRVDLRLRSGFLVLGELAHHRGEGRRVKRGDLAFVLGFERARVLQLALERGLDLRVVRRREKVGEIPANVFRASRLECFHQRLRIFGRSLGPSPALAQDPASAPRTRLR